MTPDRKPIIRRVAAASLTTLLATPLQVLFFLISGTILYGVNPYLVELFGFNFINTAKLTINSFIEFYLYSLGQFAVNILLCILLRKITKISLHFSLLISIFAISAILLPSWIAGPAHNWPPVLDDFGFFLAVPHILTFVQFAVYCAAIQLLNKKCIWNERERTLASSGIALLLGLFISWLAWLIVYSIYTR